MGRLAPATAASPFASTRWPAPRLDPLASPFGGKMQLTFYAPNEIPGFSSAGNLVPANRDKDKKHKIRAFPNLLDSVRAYAHNLNTHAAYRQMRKVRSNLRLKGAPLDGLVLVENLKSYSQRGQKYVEGIRALIKGNNLHRFDDARLRDGGTIPRPLI